MTWRKETRRSEARARHGWASGAADPVAVLGVNLIPEDLRAEGDSGARGAAVGGQRTSSSRLANSCGAIRSVSSIGVRINMACCVGGAATGGASTPRQWEASEVERLLGKQIEGSREVCQYAAPRRRSHHGSCRLLRLRQRLWFEGCHARGAQSDIEETLERIKTASGVEGHVAGAARPLPGPLSH